MSAKLEDIIKIEGIIEVLSGLHIGAGDSEIRIGGIDNPVVKDPEGYPYIPGSSLKGKCRCLLELLYGFYDNNGGVSSWKLLEQDKNTENNNNISIKKAILKLFGCSASSAKEAKEEIFITRVKFNDAFLSEEDKKKDLSKIFESKFENSINRLSGTADHPRQTERVAKGNKFNFSIVLKIFKGDKKDLLLNTLFLGLKLIEEFGLGGNVSRGYGQVKFKEIKITSMFGENKDDFKNYIDEKGELKSLEHYKK